MYIFCRFGEVSAIRKRKIMTFSVTGSQTIFANFVIYARNKRKTVHWFIVHTTSSVSPTCKNLCIGHTFL